MTARFTLAILIAALCAASGAGCERPALAEGADELVIAAYSAPREAFEEGIVPAFRAEWRRRTGRDIVVRGSYLGSGAQVRAVVQGFEADIAVLALETDMDKLTRAGLVSPRWRERTGSAGVVARSLVVAAVRPGNPRGIRDWPDLARDGLEVLTPNPRTSGGAMWNVVGLYGAAAERGGAARGLDLVSAVFGNVAVMDKAARESLVNFERGVGDVAITYEQEVYVARRAGRRYDYVIPPSTAVIEIPGSIIDRHVEARGTRAQAEAFLAFLSAAEGQRILLEFGFRPARGPLDVPGERRFPSAGRPFTVQALGGWAAVLPMFARGGALARAMEPTDVRQAAR